MFEYLKKKKKPIHPFSLLGVFPFKINLYFLADNDVIDHIGAVYAVNDTEVSWSTKPGKVYDEN